MKSIVYVDDEPALCRVLGMVLRQLDVEVHTFTNPLEALEHIRANPPAVVVSDHRMPEMDGLTLFTEIDSAIPFVLLSGDLSLVDERLSQLAGVIHKPIRPERLVEMIGEFL